MNRTSSETEVEDVGLSDSEIIVASLVDAERFGLLFDRHVGSMHASLSRRVGHGAADDIVAELFRIAFQRRFDYQRDRDDARPWLFGIATNLVMKHRAREVRQLQPAALREAPPEDDLDDVDHRLAFQQQWPAVATALSTLPGIDRDTLLLIAWDDLTYAQTAEALGVPIGTVRSRVHRARHQLRELLAAPPEEQVTATSEEATDG